MKPASTVLLLLLAVNVSAGPIFPTRSFILAPAFRSAADTTSGAKFLREQGIWGNLARAYHSANDRFGWSISFGGVIQFVEWEHSMIYLTGDAEVLADTHNDISFNPRAILWTEGVVYSDQVDATELSIGYIHRCHHDIDDLDNNVASPHQERTLIYGSAMAKAVWRDIAWFRSTLDRRCDAYVQLDKYMILQDDRIPNSAAKRSDVNTLDLSLSAGFYLDMIRLGSAALYARAELVGAWYDRYRSSTADARGELGVALFGEGSAMNIFIGTERLTDDYNSVEPVNSGYLYLGFRFVGTNAGR